MSRTMFGYVFRLFLGYFAALFLVVMVVFLIADFGDRVKAFVEHPWVDVVELYWNKALVAAHQLGPAAMLLAAGAGISTLRKRGELTALRSLAFGTATLYLPVAVATLVGSALFIVFDEQVVTKAGVRVEDITVNKFNVWGDWRFHWQRKRWFRSGEQVFFLRSGDVETGFRDVTILSLSPDFTLRARIDADGMAYVGKTRWRLQGAHERLFDDAGGSLVDALGDVERDLGVTGAAFRIRQGRPEQMKVEALLEQIAARRQVGLPAQRFVLALHNRFAYPLTGMAAALLAVGLALRPGRKGHLTVALVEGLMVAVALWGMMVIGKSLVVGDRMPAPLAAWSPFVILTLAAGFLWLRREGRLGREGT
ncbi:MAG: LptF/LptG family permease [Myxococcota bacterium]